MDQGVIHAIGDYILQSDWMANGKTKAWQPAFAHALVYSLGFLLLKPSLAAWLVIFGTHYLIDRYRLARYVVWAKNWMGAKGWWALSVDGWKTIDKETAQVWREHKQGVESSEKGMLGFMVFQAYTEVKLARMLPFKECSATGYPPDRPAWLAVWLLIIADNILHVCINGAALRWL
jgi:hypothetical protein